MTSPPTTKYLVFAQCDCVGNNPCACPVPECLGGVHGDLSMYTMKLPASVPNGVAQRQIIDHMERKERCPACGRVEVLNIISELRTDIALVTLGLHADAVWKEKVR